MIKYLHIRRINPETNQIEPFGGATLAYTCTETDIMVQVALCHDNDTFCRQTGRQVAAGRLRKHGPREIIPIKHPKSEALIEWFATAMFTTPISIARDKDGRWVTTFD